MNTLVAVLRRRRAHTAGPTERGQIMVIFAGLLIVLLLMSALVVDLGWLWSNTLRIQRAADAAALAGVVHLPANLGNSAYLTAKAEAKKNGYADGVGGVVVTPAKDPDNARRLDVSVEAPVKTFFLQLIGMPTVDIRRTAQADYVLPVPMGSPLNYYGVGDFTTVVPGAPGNTGQKAPTSTTSPNDWSSASGAYSSGGSAASDDDGDSQGYEDFSFSVPSGATVSGIEVRVTAKSTDSTGCQIGVMLYNGSDWTDQERVDLTGSYETSVIGSSSSLWGESWAPSSFDNGTFELRVQDRDPGGQCKNSARTDLDYVTVTVYYTSAATVQTAEITDQGGSPLCGRATCSQGFWGAIEGQGSNRSTGDAYATGYNGSPTKNGDYDANGYDYTLEMPSGGSVYVFDPTFCATSSSSTGGHYGAGDHWLGDAVPVSTYFQLWNMNGTQLRADDTLIKSSASLFEDEYQADLLTGSNFSDGGEPSNPTDCSVGAISNAGQGGYYHNKWWHMANVSAGTYRLQVTTTKPGSPNANWDESFENMWSLLVQGGGKPHIYGSGRMVSYANIPSGQQEFYLAQIDRASGAGKTMEIRLFDPGDVGQKAWMQIFSPDGNAYNKATFDYSADNGRSGTNVTCIQTYGGSGPSAPAGCPNDTSGGTYYQNSWITINVPLPASYGSTGLTPPGETEAGWWKIRYTVNSGNDTTTWEVSLRGNPVHLVVP